MHQSLKPDSLMFKSYFVTKCEHLGCLEKKKKCNIWDGRSTMTIQCSYQAQKILHMPFSEYI